MKMKAFLCFTFLFSFSFAQCQNLGVMLFRLHIEEVEGDSGFSYEDAYLDLYGFQEYKTESEMEEVEKQFFPGMQEALAHNLKNKNFALTHLNYADLTREEVVTENKFFNKVAQDYQKSVIPKSFSNSLTSKNKRRKNHKLDKTIGPLANIFADKLNSDYLVFFQARGWYNPKSFVGDKLNALITESSVKSGGSLTLNAYIVDGNSGKILAYSRVNHNSRPLFKKGKEEKSQKIIEKLCESSIILLMKDWESMKQ